jgi:hypothetical protein
MTEYTTIKLSGPLCARIEEFLRGRPEYGTLEEFVVDATRIRREQLATKSEKSDIPPGPATGPLARDEEYSHSTLEAGWDALSKPVTSEEKQYILKGLVQEFRKLKAANREAADRGGIQ